MNDTAKKVAKIVDHSVRKIAKADRKATHAMAGLRDTPSLKAVNFLAQVADQPELITIAVATIGAGLATRRPELVRGGSRMLASHLVATGLKILVKHQVNRSRPKKSLADGDAQFEAGHSHDHDLNSFPSGHTAGAVAVARAAAHEIDGAALPVTIATGAVALAQAPTGSHYLTDVLAGGAIGWASEALVGAVFDRVEPLIERRLAEWRDAGAGAEVSPS